MSGVSVAQSEIKFLRPEISHQTVFTPAFQGLIPEGFCHPVCFNKLHRFLPFSGWTLAFVIPRALSRAEDDTIIIKQKQRRLWREQERIMKLSTGDALLKVVYNEARKSNNLDGARGL